MFFRQISNTDVRVVVNYGEIIEEYPDDEPYASCLMMDFVKGRPLHVVLSHNPETNTCYVVTAYVPNPQLWRNNFRSRR